MSSRIMKAVLFGGVLLGATGCATSEDWRMWLSHTTHFASGEHGGLSLHNNTGGSNPSVGRMDVENSRQQSWWGVYAVNVSAAQVFAN